MSATQMRTSSRANSVINAELICQATLAFDALDLSAEQAEISKLRDEKDKIQEALQIGTEKLAKARTDLNNYAGPNGTSVANMLLAGGPNSDVLSAAGRNKSDLQEEVSVLTDAIADLRRRHDSAERRIGEIQRKARHRVFECLLPLVDSLDQEAREAAGRVVEAFTVLRTIAQVTDRRIDGDQLGEKAVRALLGPPGLVTRTERLEVPEVIQSLFASLTNKGEALPNMVITSVYAP